MTDQVLFKYKEYVQLWQTGRNSPNINGPMIQYYTKVYKGATNTIDFVVRNNDRQPVNLIGYQIEALIQRVENPEILLIKTVNPTNDRAGKAELLLFESDVSNWLAGYYRYSIRLTDMNGRQEFLYTDINRSTSNTFELIEGMAVSLAPAIEILGSQFTPYPLGFYDDTWATGALTGNSQDDRLNGMNTVVAYTTKFIGKFWVQASISNQAPLENEWFDIQLTQYTNYFEYTRECSPRIQAFNFTGNYNWVRMFYHKGWKKHGFDQDYFPDDRYQYDEYYRGDRYNNREFGVEKPDRFWNSYEEQAKFGYGRDGYVNGEWPQIAYPKFGIFDKVLFKN